MLLVALFGEHGWNFKQDLCDFDFLARGQSKPMTLAQLAPPRAFAVCKLQCSLPVYIVLGQQGF